MDMSTAIIMLKSINAAFKKIHVNVPEMEYKVTLESPVFFTKVLVYDSCGALALCCPLCFVA